MMEDDSQADNVHMITRTDVMARWYDRERLISLATASGIDMTDDVRNPQASEVRRRVVELIANGVKAGQNHENLLGRVRDLYGFDGYDLSCAAKLFINSTFEDFLDSVGRLVKDKIDAASPTTFAQLLSELTKSIEISSFKAIGDPFAACQQYARLLNALEDCDYLAMAPQLLWLFKRYILEVMSAHLTSLTDEIQIISLVGKLFASFDFTLNAEQLRPIFETHFRRNLGSLRNFFERLENICPNSLSTFAELAEMADQLESSSINRCLVQDDLREKVTAYCAEPSKRLIEDNGFIVEVESYFSLLINEKLIKTVAAEYFDSSDATEKVEEVRFIASGDIYIASNLTWPGLNVILFANNDVIVLETGFTWNLSGPDATKSFVYDKAADATRPGEDGASGESGSPGESGGNLLLVANAVADGRKWTVRPNGGSGSPGQAGGDGQPGTNGKNGAEMTKYQISAYSSKSLLDTAKELLWMKRADETYQKLLGTDGVVVSMNFSGEPALRDGDFYLEGRFKCGTTFEHSQYGSWSRGGYLIAYGAQGEKGQLGGRGGLGGKGGEGGPKGNLTVQLFNGYSTGHGIEFQNNKGAVGKDGARGISGSDGMPGNNGRDVAWKSRAQWRFDETKEGHLRVVETTSWRDIWSPYRNLYVKIEDDPGKPQRVAMAHDERQTQTQKKCMVAVSQRGISTDAIVTRYQHRKHLTSNDLLGVGLDDLQSHIAAALDRLDKELEQDDQTEATHQRLVEQLSYHTKIRRRELRPSALISDNRASQAKTAIDEEARRFFTDCQRGSLLPYEDAERQLLTTLSMREIAHLLRLYADCYCVIEAKRDDACSSDMHALCGHLIDKPSDVERGQWLACDESTLAEIRRIKEGANKYKETLNRKLESIKERMSAITEKVKKLVFMGKKQDEGVEHQKEEEALANEKREIERQIEAAEENTDLLGPVATRYKYRVGVFEIGSNFRMRLKHIYNGFQTGWKTVLLFQSAPLQYDRLRLTAEACATIGRLLIMSSKFGLGSTARLLLDGFLGALFEKTVTIQDFTPFCNNNTQPYFEAIRQSVRRYGFFDLLLKRFRADGECRLTECELMFLAEISMQLATSLQSWSHRSFIVVADLLWVLCSKPQEDWIGELVVFSFRDRGTGFTLKMRQKLMLDSNQTCAISRRKALNLLAQKIMSHEFE